MRAILHTAADFCKTHPHMWWGLFLPAYLAAFFTVERVVPDAGRCWITDTALDAAIPFCEQFIVFYVIWAPLLTAVGVYLILRDGEGFRRYMWMLILCFGAATLFCLLVPNAQTLRPAVMPRSNPFTWMVQLIYAADTNTNVFPSVHILGVCAAAAAVWKTPGLRRWYWRTGVTVLGTLIAASTLLVKQHALIDVAAGFVLAAAGYAVVYGVIGAARDRKRGTVYG